MKVSRRCGAALMGALLLSAACDDAGTDPSETLDAEDLAFLAVESDAMAGAMIFGRLGIGHVVRPTARRDGEFEHTRDCPAGGSMSIAGSVERMQHDDGVIEGMLDAGGDWDECAHARQRGDRAITITIDGSFEIEASRKHDNRVPVGAQTTWKSGSFTWERTSGDETHTGECRFDVTSVRSPESGRITVKGTICGREIDRSVSWRHGT